MLRRDPTIVQSAATCIVARDARGVTIDGMSLEHFELPAEFRVPGLNESETVRRSEHVRFALEQLHAEHGFVRIEFPVAGGLAFRAIQAKRAGLAFEGVVLAVRLDACGAWQREEEQCWPAGYEEVEEDFAERFTFENADEVDAPHPQVLAFVQRIGWRHDLTPRPPSLRGKGEEEESAASLVTIGIAHYNLGRHLPATLASLAEQTYANIEVIVIDDGSNDPESIAVFAEMQGRYSRWRFLRQNNAGIGATRNRCLELARGEFFIPVDADNIARPTMVEQFVRAIQKNPDLAAMTCYFLAFADGDGDPPPRFLHALRPAGGPHVLAGIRNVYGDANAIFRTQVFRDVGGYETDRGTSCEDWEAFVKLVHAGRRIGVIPDHLFYYRHLTNGFSRRTNWFANHQRVLRQFANTPGESAALWTVLLGFHQRLEQLQHAPRPRRHRIADAVHAAVACVPRVIRNVFRQLRRAS